MFSKLKECEYFEDYKRAYENSIFPKLEKQFNEEEVKLIKEEYLDEQESYKENMGNYKVEIDDYIEEFTDKLKKGL